MTPDERLQVVLDEIKAEDEDKVFEALRMICEAFNWEISRRDPGPHPAYGHFEAAGMLDTAPVKASYRKLALVRRVP